MTEKDLIIQKLRRENDRLTKRADLAESSLYLAVERIPKWIKTADKLPEPQTYVLGRTADTNEVHECYTFGGTNFVFPTLYDVHPVDMWAAIPTPGEAMGDG